MFIPDFFCIFATENLIKLKNMTVIIPSTERCVNCFTTVQFESSDVQVADYADYHEEYGSTSVYYHYIVCPYCGNEIRLD